LQKGQKRSRSDPASRLSKNLLGTPWRFIDVVQVFSIKNLPQSEKKPVTGYEAMHEWEFVGFF
jgi:hypothetical protein